MARTKASYFFHFEASVLASELSFYPLNFQGCQYISKTVYRRLKAAAPDNFAYVIVSF